MDLKKKRKLGHFSQKGLSSRLIILRSTFSMISKKSNLEGVFEFFYSNPQLDQNLKPTKNLCGQLIYIYILYIYLCIYVFSVEYILKWKKLKDTFDTPSNPIPSHPIPPHPIPPGNKTFSRSQNFKIIIFGWHFFFKVRFLTQNCKVTGNKERNQLKFYEGNSLEKSSPKNWNRLQIFMKNPA